MPRSESERQAKAVERLTFFSDAVAAIALTLLAIDLPVPRGGTAAQFWASARAGGSHYAAFGISFAVIAAAWSAHHDLYQYAERMDGRLRLINTGWLLTIVLVPFAAKLLTTHGQETPVVHALRFGTYALLQVLESGLLLAARRYMVVRDLAPGLPPKMAEANWQSAGMLIGFALSVPLFFVTSYAWILWAAAPVAVGQNARRQRRRRHPGPA